MTVLSGKDLYQIKVTLADSKPPIWRRLIVPKTIHLDELHMVIQLAMGWMNDHLYCFEKGNLRYGIKFDDDPIDTGIKSSEGVTLKFLLRKEKDKITYLYDFGDYWEHSILLEKSSLPDAAWPHIPLCIKGKGACPAEDSGGVWGYYQMLEDARNPGHPDHKEIYRWLADTIDEREYDLNAINARISAFYAS